MKNSGSLFNITQLIRASNSLPASEPTGEYFPATQTSISFLSAVKCECVSVSRRGEDTKENRPFEWTIRIACSSGYICAEEKPE